jgi:DNA polymerase
MLETDYLLGVRHVALELPIIMPAPVPASAMGGPRRAARPASPGAASYAARSASAAPAGPSEENHAKVVRLDMPIDEYNRRHSHLRDIDEKQVRQCTKCHLHETRTKTVFGQGDIRTRLVFVGEAPGFDEDQQGLAFVGKAGQLLTKMIEAMGLKREWVFICNILKCRPPDNRTPAPDEINACWPYLDEQLRTIQPDIIVALGKPASQTLLRTDESIGRLRGVWREYYPSGTVGEGQPIALMPTYHPAYLLRSPNEKGKAWSDLKQVMERLGLPMR